MFNHQTEAFIYEGLEETETKVTLVDTHYMITVSFMKGLKRLVSKLMNWYLETPGYAILL